jgi:phosphoglycolate phosphatase
MKTVLFDFDGTIVDTLDLTWKSFNRVAPKYNLPLIKETDLPQLKNLSSRELLKMFPLSPWKLLHLTRDIQAEHKKKMHTVKLIPGMAEILCKLTEKGIEVGIVTSNSRENVELFLDTHNLASISFVHAEKNLFGKDKMLKNVLKTRMLSSKDSVYVGDEVRDIEASHKAGLRVISVSWGFNSLERLKKAQPDDFATSAEELLQKIDSILCN